MLIKANKPGFISAWRPLGKAALATVTYPFRANTNEGTLLIGSDGAAIDVDEGSVREEDRATPAWRAFAAAHPDAMPFAPADSKFFAIHALASCKSSRFRGPCTVRGAELDSLCARLGSGARGFFGLPALD